MTGHPRTCVMPDCASVAVVRNRANQGTCETHRVVVVTGSWVNKAGATEGGHG